MYVKICGEITNSDLNHLRGIPGIRPKARRIFTAGPVRLHSGPVLVTRNSRRIARLERLCSETIQGAWVEPVRFTARAAWVPSATRAHCEWADGREYRYVPRQNFPQEHIHEIRGESSPLSQTKVGNPVTNIRFYPLTSASCKSYLWSQKKQKAKIHLYNSL